MPRLFAIASVATVLVAAACAAPAPELTAAPTAPLATAVPAQSSPPSPTASMTPTPSPTLTTRPTPAPTATATAAPTVPATSFPDGAVIVTFQVGAEQFRVLLTDPANVAIARALLAGGEAPPIPNGLIVYGDPSVNAPWNWHLDPDSIEFADITIEVCDGLPSYVEDRIVTSDRFCPWSAHVVAVDPAQ